MGTLRESAERVIIYFFTTIQNSNEKADKIQISLLE